VPRLKPKVNTTYAQMGMAALLPGMQHMIELMQAEFDELKQYLAGLQNSEPGKVGKPAGKSGWPDDPAERSAEMKRRMAVAKGLAKAKQPKPQQPSALSLERKKAWAALSPRKRKARLAAMIAGRHKQPTVNLEVAS